jgi:hypothetical protein
MLHIRKWTYKQVIIPKPKIPVPMIGKIQWVFAAAVHPYQNRPMGTKSDPRIRAGIRISGFATPLFLSASCRNWARRYENRQYTAYGFINTIGKFSAKYGGKKESNTEAQVSEASNSCLEVICLAKKFGKCRKHQVIDAIHAARNTFNFSKYLSSVWFGRLTMPCRD